MQTHLVFVCVAELCIHHMYDAAFVCSHVEAKLLLPGPGIKAGNSCLAKLLHHTDVVNNIQDQSLQLQLQDAGFCTGRRENIRMAELVKFCK